MVRDVRLEIAEILMFIYDSEGYRRFLDDSLRKVLEENFTLAIDMLCENKDCMGPYILWGVYNDEPEVNIEKSEYEDMSTTTYDFLNGLLTSLILLRDEKSTIEKHFERQKVIDYNGFFRRKEDVLLIEIIRRGANDLELFPGWEKREKMIGALTAELARRIRSKIMKNGRVKIFSYIVSKDNNNINDNDRQLVKFFEELILCELQSEW